MQRSPSGSAADATSSGNAHSPIAGSGKKSHHSYSASVSLTAGAGQRMSSASGFLYGGGTAAAGSYGGGEGVAEVGVKSVTTAREKEKKDMQDLNMRFANYIEKNRFLEAQLKAVEQKLKELQAKWGKETAAVKQMYEAELKEVRDLYDGAEGGKAKCELHIRALEDQLAELRRK